MMLVVRITGWRGGRPPLVPPQAIARTFAETANMGERESMLAATRLMRGKSVDAYFDSAEHAAAESFLEETHRIGLESKLYNDQ